MVTLPSPVRLVRVDLDTQPSEIRLDVEVGHRLWVEVHKGGQVIAVVERAADSVGISHEALVTLSHEFSDVEPPPPLNVPSDELPRATVVVPTIYQRVDLLKQTVQSLLSQDYPNFEIIVVDNRRGVVREPIADFSDERVRIVAEPTPGASSARNRGILEARGDFIAFTDDDAEVDRGWLRALGTAFSRDDAIDVIGGLVRPCELDTAPQLWFEEFYGGFTKSLRAKEWSLELVGTSDPLFPYSAGHFGAGCNMAIRRTTALRIRGFDPRLGIGTSAKGGEDLRVFIDVVLDGGKIAYVPTAMVRHSHRNTERELYRQIFGYGTGLTAMMTSLIVDDRSQLLKIAARAPRALRMLFFPTTTRSPSAATSYPQRLQLFQVLGMAYGPIAFFASATKRRSLIKRSH